MISGSIPMQIQMEDWQSANASARKAEVYVKVAQVESLYFPQILNGRSPAGRGANLENW